MKRDATALKQRYLNDHVFKSLVDVVASHFRTNLGYTKREILDAVATAEMIIRDNRQAQYISVEHEAVAAG